jgi:hypothetical protein
MMTISCSGSQVDISLGETRRVSVEMRGVAALMLLAERRPCGRIGHTLVVASSQGTDPVRIDGSLAELGAIHEVLMEKLMSERTIVH